MTAFAGAVALRPDGDGRLPVPLPLTGTDAIAPGGWHAEGAVFAARPARTPSTEDDEEVILCSARLDAVEPLARALGLDPGTDDAALLAAAYRRWGEGFVDHVQGEYAFAAWSTPHRRLFLARDAIGGRPLHYRADDGRLLFATDLPVLRALPGAGGALALDYLTGWMSRDEKLSRTGNAFTGIALLPAGHCLTADAAGLRRRRWWRAPPARPRPAAGSGAALRELMTTAIHDRMRGGGKIGVQLSGGLDSSTVACIAARHLKRNGQRLTAIASVLPDGWSGVEADERAHVQAVLAQEDNIDIEWVAVPPETSLFDGIEERFALFGAPTFAANQLVETHLARRARACGVETLLSGFGGDFYASFRGPVIPALLRSGQILRAGRELAAIRRRSGRPALGVIRGELVAPTVAKILGKPPRDTFLGPVLRAFAARDRARLHRQRGGRFQAPTPRGQMLALLDPVHVELVPNATFTYADRACGLSLLYPLMDRRIVEFMVALPPGELQRDGQTRAIFRAATAGILPETVRQRTDKGAAFDPLLTARLIAERPALEAWAQATEGRRCWGYVDRAAFLDALARLEPGRRDSWRPELFFGVVNGGILARYIDWLETGGFFDG